ncbi:sorbosone dehydrogenase family protein [Dietzia sp. ANT_WB102]|uniref:PQQ-dependent sugar dehydrogenase n=1 Tax=Dietzia sp. ANT_WB102 TaxID=2597345 RepID=UPI0011EF9E2B|nr:PQQ-dependent sugar dehydrogenase [Dietzia sp. ANT_WB102]KAA0918695.1 PQQ-dependent sugar dehydrogenase [Dietzia sp. ANT_WB102]
MPRTVFPRVLAGITAVIAVTVVVPLTACAQSSLPGGGSSGGSSTDSLGSLAPDRPLPPGPAVAVDTVADGFTIPWDVVRDPAGVIVTGERGSGTLHAIREDGRRSTVAADFGTLATGGESGLMGLALAHDFATSREVYTCHSSADAGDNRVTAWHAADDWSRLESPRVLVKGIPLADGGRHSGCRILAHSDGTLYIGTGDAFTGPAPQDLTSLSGKILHITRTGTPADGTIGDSPVLTFGHRNVQGLAQRPGSDQIIAAEHGPDVDDEVNLVIPGRNYGWNPNSGGTYNQNVPMTDTRAFPDAVQSSWRSGAPTLAPGGIAFLDDPAWGDWDGALAVTMLKTSQVVLMKLSPDGTSVTETAAILRGEHGRLRSITPEPGGSLLVTTSNGDGNDEVLRISPAVG